MGDILLLFVAFMATLAAGVVSLYLIFRGRYQRQVRAGERPQLEQQDRDATGAYLEGVDRATTLAELERLATEERIRRSKWDGSS